MHEMFSRILMELTSIVVKVKSLPSLDRLDRVQQQPHSPPVTELQRFDVFQLLLQRLL